jgi:hypothetical protein
MSSNHVAAGGIPHFSAPLFVGREREVATLRAGLATALGGRTQIFLLAGEPGIGKTRLAAEIASDAARLGATVLWGRCCEDAGAPPFWPWAQILRHWLEAGRASAGAADTLVRSSLLAQIVPELGDGPRVDPAPRSGELRFELFDAVARFLRQAALAQPLVLIFDDLHAADPASLSLLQFLARHVTDAPILLLCSYRPADLERVRECAEAVAQISRVATRLPLTALSAGNVGDLVTGTLGAEASDGLAASVFRLTEGNPFFVAEVLQLLLAERDASGRMPADAERAGLPHGVRELVLERLRPLSGPCRSVLECAAVLGRDFDTSALQLLVDGAPSAVAEALAEANRAGLLTPTGGDEGDYGFTHVLIRETLQSTIAAPRLAQLHRRAAEGLERLDARGGADVARIAHHYTQAARMGDRDKAIDFAERAARQAMRQWAWEEASRLYDQALEALALGSEPAIARRLELLLAKGRADQAAGTPAARATYLRAADLAREHGLAEPFANAVLGLADLGLGILGLEPEEAVVALLEEAAAKLPAGDLPLSVRVRAHLAAHLSFPATRERSLGLIADVERAARELGDDATLAVVLSQQHLILWRFNLIAGRITIAEELIALAERLGERDLAWFGHAWRVVDCMTLGDADGIDAGLKVLVARAEASRQPRFLWVAHSFRAARALWRGEWREAEAHAFEELQLSSELADPLAPLAAPIQLFLAWRELGRPSDEAELQKAVDRFPDSAMIRACLITVQLDNDRVDQARTGFERLAVGDFAGLRRERRLGALALLCEACWRLGDARRAPALADLLAPFADGNVMYAASVCFGAAARFLGQLAALGGDLNAAADHFAEAAERNRRMGAVAPLAWTLFDEAKMWQPHAPERTRALLREARAIAAPLSMGRLATEIDAVEAALAMPLTIPAAAAATTASGHGVFRREGGTWTVGTGQREIHVVDTKGMAYIAELLRKPGMPITAIELGGSGPEPFSAGEALVDRQAREAYRRRLAELRSEIDEAGDLNDIGRVQHLQIEAGELEQELSRVIGLHGRVRRGGNTAERARLNVTRAIRTAIRKIEAGDAGCGRFFAATIRTGNVCLYLPGADAPSDWAL